MESLYFDVVEVDTSLAKEYIKNNNIDVEEPNRGTAWDYVKKTVVDFPFKHEMESLVSGIDQKLRNLSKKIQDNSELFCQLEYLMRKTDVDDTRNCHLKIISQYLRLETWSLNTWNDFDLIIIDESTPLYCLGHVATVLRSNTTPILICEKTTAPICHLFYKLCLDVGLGNILIYLINNTDSNSLPYFRTRKLSKTMGCTLAITEDADIDSAVDVFINSSVQAPWRIERVYVQESVYEQVMDALETRCTRVASERCVDAFRTARGRGVECGAGAGAGGGVPVRAYRGARDLLALLPSEGGSLSLWCGAAAAAHELALASPSDLVWIDHYAVFDGPPSASFPLYYDSVRHLYAIDYYIPENIYTRLLELRRTWIALPLDERKAVVVEVLEKTSSDCADDALTIAKLAEHITAWKPADLVDIALDRITMVIDRSSSETVFVNNEREILEILKSTILGYSNVIISIVNHLQLVTSKLFDAGVPLTKWKVTNDKEPEFTHNIKSEVFYRNKKVIHSRFGTIYAN